MIHKPLYYYNFENPNSSFRNAGEKCFYKPFHCIESNKILRKAGLLDIVKEEIGWHEFRSSLGHTKEIKLELREEYFIKLRELMQDVEKTGLKYKLFPVYERSMLKLLLKGDVAGFYQRVDFKEKINRFVSRHKVLNIIKSKLKNN